VAGHVEGAVDALSPDHEGVLHPGEFSTFTLIDGDLNSYLWLGRLATLYYFAFFLLIMPIVGLRETPLPVPASVSEPVLSGGAMPAAVPAQAEKQG
jgi:ubiquinol-cytochrome c reductase cytochrome b subunit